MNKKTIFSIILTLALFAVYAIHLTKTHQAIISKNEDMTAGKTPQDAGYLKPQKDIGSLEEIKDEISKIR